MNAKLCFVEDDPTIRELVSKKLGKFGFEVDVFEDAESVLALPFKWDLYILDVMLSGDTSGLQLCEEIRKSNASAPVLMLSALSDSSDRIDGLRVGADDYLTKPFEMEELLLRVQGMLRRRSWYGKLPKESSTHSWDGRSVDFLKLVGSNHENTFPLTQKEAMLMKLLIEREGDIVSRDEMLDRVWGYDVYPSSRTVDNFILRLRKYFEDEPANPRYLHSVRGMGYKFTSKGI